MREEDMYVKLIQPRMNKRPMDTDLKTHMSPPLGLLTVMSLLREEHHVVLFLPQQPGDTRSMTDSGIARPARLTP